MKNETKIQNQNETKNQNQDVNEKTFSQLKTAAKHCNMSISAYVMLLEYKEKNIGEVYFSRYRESDKVPYENLITGEEVCYSTPKIMCRDEEAPKFLKAILFTKSYEEAEMIIKFRLEKYSKNNNVAFNDIEPAVVIEIMQSVANLYEDAKLIKLND